MSRQQSLGFTKDQLELVWSSLPKRWREEVVTIWAQLIAGEVQGQSSREDTNDDDTKQ